MPEIRNTFLAGRMDKDADARIIGNGLYRHAENIRVANSEGSDVGAIEKTLSNTLLTSLGFTGTISTLGSLKDEFEEKIYWAVKDDNGCYIVEHTISPLATAYVLQDTRIGALNVLGFNASKLLQMELIVDSDNDNRLLVFTDDNTSPKCVNVERAKTYGVNGFDEEDILLIKKPPIFSPTLTLGDTGTKENNIKEKFLFVFYRYQYLDGEYSAISPASECGFIAKSFDYDYSVQTNESMVNYYNEITINFNTGSDLVTDIEVIFKESGSNNLYLIERLNKTKKSWADNSTQSIVFENNKIYRVLPEAQLYRLYDNVPLLAKALAVINNRIVFGNYTENYNLLDSLGAAVIADLTSSLVTTAIVNGIATKSMKSIRDYEVAISYLDDYGRMTTPLTSEGNTVYIPNSNCVTKNEIKVAVANKPPAFASYYRFFIKQTKVDYESVIPTLFYQDGLFVWIKLDGGDKDKVHDGDFLYVKADTQGILSDVIQTKVLEVKEQEWNFIDTEETTATLQLAGLYFKIKPNGFRINVEDFTNYTFESYDSSSNANDNPIRSEVNVIEPAVYYGPSPTSEMVSSGTYSGTVDIRYLVELFTVATFATGTVTCATVLAGDTVTVNGLLYTAVAGAKADNTEFSVDTGDTECATDLADSITNDTRTGALGDTTATNVLGVVTITTDVEGTAGNAITLASSDGVTLAVSGATFSGANDDTYQWSNDDGSSFDDNGGLGYTITGAAQTLENGVEITFTSVTGHHIDDYWIVSAKCSTDDGFGANESSKAYAFFKSLASNGFPNDDDVIEGGARITITYNEYNEANEYVNETFISSRRYANLEEWWFGDNIQGSFPIASTRIWFRRGTLTQNGGAKYFTQDPVGDMTLIIKSSGTQNNDADSMVKVTSTLTIFQSEQNIIFETKPIDNNSDIYYEIGQTYAITGGYHIGNGGSDINQSSGIDAEIILPIFNCFAWGNGFESYKIKDEFNAPTMKMDTRPSTTIENYRQNKRIASLTWSNVYEQSTNYNALNEFNLSLVNYKDLDDRYGSVQAMVSWNTDLDVWQEDKVHKIFYDKQVIYNRDGSSNLAASNNILDNVVAYTGEYGISNNPESLVVYSNYTYWADVKRGVVLRKGQSGIELISDNGMRDWFGDQFLSGNTTKILGGYDPYFGQYVLNINGYTLTFDEKVKGWTSFHSYLPDWIQRVNNRLYTIKNGELYLHNDDTNGYCMYYGTQFSAKVTTIFNQEAQFDKRFKTIVLEGDAPWDITLLTNFTNSTIADTEFNQRESRWFGYIRKNESTTDLRTVTQGIGNILGVLGGVVTFDSVPSMVSVGDTLYQMNGATKEIVGVITDKDSTTVTITTIVTTPVAGYFSFSKKAPRIEGSSVRGYYLEATLEDGTNTANELFAVSSNAVRSFI